MFVTEFDSFVKKFHQLWEAGLTAHLDADTHAGKAWVGIRVQLGHVPGPAMQPHVHRRGPAYQRRRERRQAARAAVEGAEKASPTDQKTSDDVSAEEAPTTREEDLVIETKESERIVSAEKAKGQFSCDVCDFKSNWANGLAVHRARKHKNVIQLDGANDLDLEESEQNEADYWTVGIIGTVYQDYLNVIDDINKSDLTERTKIVERRKVIEARKMAIGSTYIHEPPWC